MKIVNKITFLFCYIINFVLSNPLIELNSPVIDDEIDNLNLSENNLVYLEILPSESFQENVESSIDNRNRRIVHGILAGRNEFPFFGYVDIRRTNQTTNCGSTLISTLWVVTAAHCMRDVTSAQVSFGSIDKDYMPVVRSVSAHVTHYQWDPLRLANDITLMKLHSAVTFSSIVKAIQLPPQSSSNKLFSGLELKSCGFGKSASGYPRYMNYVNLYGVTDYECKAAHWVFQPKILCAKGMYGGSICLGDSGGPLFQMLNGTPIFIGVNSFVQSAECVNDIQGFTRVDKYLSWINSHTGIAIKP